MVKETTRYVERNHEKSYSRSYHVRMMDRRKFFYLCGVDLSKR
jgi:hypothetical protein